MRERDPSLLAAEDRSGAARADLRIALEDARDRFSPTRLKAEAAIAASRQVDEAKLALRRSVNRHPVAAWSAVTVIAAIATYTLRRPVAAFARTGRGTLRALRKRLIRRKKKP